MAEEFLYKCENCGQCCKNWNPAQHDISLVDENGVCKFLNQETNLCTIYDKRPIFCRTYEYYEQIVAKSQNISLEYYLHQQRMGCDILRTNNPQQ
jgi:Fe-S-cluster containining protein